MQFICEKGALHLHELQIRLPLRWSSTLTIGSMCKPSLNMLKHYYHAALTWYRDSYRPGYFHQISLHSRAKHSLFHQLMAALLAILLSAKHAHKRKHWAWRYSLHQSQDDERSANLALCLREALSTNQFPSGWKILFLFSQIAFRWVKIPAIVVTANSHLNSQCHNSGQYLLKRFWKRSFPSWY